MTTKVTTGLQLSDEWVDTILTTAFDGTYGGCWYWVNEEDAIDEVFLWEDYPRPLKWALLAINNHEMFRDEVLDDGYGAAHLDAESLAHAYARLITEPICRDELRHQLCDALVTPDELPDLDADATDALVQVALFGEIVYG